MNRLFLIFLFLVVGLSGCQSTPANNYKSESNLTVGLAQKHIKIGMDQASVIAVLGSPNMVSTNKERNEIWVYDKVSTSSMSRSSEGFVFALLAGASTNSNSRSTSQQTLTIVIKFDSDGLVNDFSYHSSKF